MSLALLAKVLGATPSRARKVSMRELRRTVSESLSPRGKRRSSKTLAEPSASGSSSAGPSVKPVKGDAGDAGVLLVGGDERPTCSNEPSTSRLSSDTEELDKAAPPPQVDRV